MPNIIETQNLVKAFGGVRAIDDLSVGFPQGETIGLIGPNGSGKTTLMNMLTGILRPSAGTMIIQGHIFRRVIPNTLRSLKIARTFQDGRLIEQLSVEDNLLLSVANNHCFKGFTEIDTKAYQARLRAVLEMTTLTDYRQKKAETLSYGLRKLLEMGRALMTDADVYFFDEPFTGLFPEVMEQVVVLLKALKEQRKTLVIIEHNMSLIQRLCDHAIVLDAGHLLAQGTSEAVLQNKRVQEAYLGK